MSDGKITLPHPCYGCSEQQNVEMVRDMSLAHAAAKIASLESALARALARAEAAEARVKELESQCAAMREALTSCLTFTACLPSIPEAHHESVKMRAALAGAAGRALMERVEAMERVVDAARYACDEDVDVDEAINALDALEPSP